MIFGSKRVNVEDNIKRINHILDSSVSKKFIDKKISAQLEQNLNGLSKFINYFLDRYKPYLHPEKISKLKQVYDKIISMEDSCKKADLHEINNMNEQLRFLLGDCFEKGILYLIRHPEKTKEAGRSLSLKGVKESKVFAELVCDEILLCPKKVNVFIFTSEIKRTALLGQMIEREIYQILHKYSKVVSFRGIREDHLLYIKWTAESEKSITPALKQGEFYAFEEWRKGNVKDTPDFGEVASEIRSFIRKNIDLPSKNEWNIIIGIGHSFNIDSYLYLATGGKIEKIIGTTEFARFEEKMMIYRKGLYNI